MRKTTHLVTFMLIFGLVACAMQGGIKVKADESLANYNKLKQQTLSDYMSGKLTKELYNECRVALCAYKTVHNAAFTQYGVDKDSDKLEKALDDAMFTLATDIKNIYGKITKEAKNG